ncbi:hypothetical protein HOLleu_23268 [Holothuria leucospilota]|uniref:WSC domain-containing protein n=1 Tax=Holothuria leucospilota TaxID=206669 RepID=A0A9Q1BV28_HOLLE|nr:hypothetical protein HOLleu_23268 [Holothuria leucospilota]
MKDHEKYLPELTIESCLIECTSAKLAYFSLEQINMCYCGRDETGFQKYGNSSNCVIPCAGNTNQTCGGQFAIDVYKIELKQCPELNPPLNGNVHQRGDKAWFDCLDGYRLRGSKIIHCNRTTFEWTIPASPICYNTFENRSAQHSKGSCELT